MSTTKTREKLVDGARQLFAKHGLENTTMNDIAVTSGKGRRTLYTYFKNKEDIYWAVIEGELERLSERMNEVAKQNMEPEDKLVEIVFTQLNMIKAAAEGLKELSSPEETAERRGITVGQMFGGKE